MDKCCQQRLSKASIQKLEIGGVWVSSLRIRLIVGDLELNFGVAMMADFSLYRGQ
jgi:hypothetical protein